MKTKTLMFLSTAALLAGPVSAKLPAPGDAAKTAEFVYPPSAPPATVAAAAPAAAKK